MIIPHPQGRQNNLKYVCNKQQSNEIYKLKFDKTERRKDKSRL